MKWMFECLAVLVSVAVINIFILAFTKGYFPYSGEDLSLWLLLWPLTNCIYLLIKTNWLTTFFIFIAGSLGVGVACLAINLISIPLDLGSQSFRTIVAKVGGHSAAVGGVSIVFFAILGSIFNDKIGILPKKK